MSISKKTWLYIGQSIFGLLIGFMVGLSISPVVSTVLGLMFAFIGGSLIVLIKGKTDDELEVIGKCITFLSSFMILGILIGVTFRANDLLRFDFLRFVNQEDRPYVITESLTVDHIEKIGSKKAYSTLICSIVKDEVKNKERSGEQKQLNMEQLKSLIDKKVNPSIILAMLGKDINCQTGNLNEPEEPGSHLLRDVTSSGSE